MSEPDSNHVTRPEMEAALKAQTYRLILYTAGIVGLANFDLPTPVTIGAAAAIVGKAVWVLVLQH